MAVSEIRHEWTTDPSLDPALFKPGEPATLHIKFDRELSQREAFELAQAVTEMHNRHEAAKDFYANDPHHARHIKAKDKAAMVGEVQDFDQDGNPATMPLLYDDGQPFKDDDGVPVEILTYTRTFTGNCADCGRAYVTGASESLPYHYVCPSLPGENERFIKFKAKPCDAGCAIDCGRPI